MKYQAILFDLDGTLIDSAPDLIATLNDLLISYSRPTVDVDKVRHLVSRGSTGLLSHGFNEDFPKDFEALRQDYLARYNWQNTRNTRFFAGIEDLLSAIEASQTPWGIVTNKPTASTQPIAAHLQLDKRASAIVCGDTLPVSKPDPSPLFLACEMLGVSPEHCAYVGDADTDVIAGQLTGMMTIACAYGYIESKNPVTAWGADAIAQTPADIWPLLQTSR